MKVEVISHTGDTLNGYECPTHKGGNYFGTKLY